MRKINEECGVFGIYSPEKTDVASTVYYGLYALQHRGQESCGIVVNDDGVFTSCKDAGLVNEVFSHHNLADLGQGADHPVPCSFPEARYLKGLMIIKGE